MANQKKLAFPFVACPKCGKPIHGRSKSHEACGWTATSKPQATPPAAATKPQSKTAPTNGEKISKMEGVRRILKEHGKDTKPVAIQDLLRKEYKIKMDASVISNYKGTILRAKKKLGRPKGQKSPTAGSGRPTTGITVDDITAVKALVDRMGPKKWSSWPRCWGSSAPLPFSRSSLQRLRGVDPLPSMWVISTAQ